FGMVGLGTMGRNFLLNVAENGFAAVGFDLSAEKRDLLEQEGSGMPVTAATNIASLAASLEKPRRIMMLVPAGPIVDSVIGDLLPHLEPGDVLVDGGNSHFPDTARREAFLKEHGIAFLGVGVSGGEEGARRGPSIMVGGDPAVYENVSPMLEAVSAKVNGEPCAAHVGRGSAGHFVKMVHNGIEYAMMQLIAEAYDLLKRVSSPHVSKGSSQKTNTEIADIFAAWNRGRLNSFLVEITATVLRKTDPETGNSLVDMILDTAGQKGTGKWTSQAAMDLGIPIPAIDSAVTMRQISAQKAFREKLSRQFPPIGNWPIDNCQLEEKEVETALYTSFIAAYAQGFSLLRAASDEMGFELDMVEIAKIWRGGCIIRAAMLDDIRAAFSEQPGLENLIASPRFEALLSTGREDLRRVVVAGAATGIPTMAFAATLNYLTAFTTERLPANLIQAQRDYFGAHTYQRTDREGTFHTDDWEA
ncbi:MAG TPA: phosphogluconate dehydrogenase (NADP(+)-dependent, decarboxylating), partial [Blastocatellia bacterium]|nr:phosphogluconate dehydrogenase (NADP(+)-dependent, decarboxylating) [Blastocatellia bacterium]